MLELKVIGLSAVKRSFLKMQGRAQKPRPVLDEIGVKAWRDVINSFRVEKDEEGAKWPKWKDPKTGLRVPERPTKRGGTKLLQDSGRLRSSIRWRSASKWVKVFTTVKYAKYSEKGIGQVRRSYMWINKKLRSNLSKMLADYIKNG